MKARCPFCAELVGASRTGQVQNQQRGSSQWVRVDAHTVGQPNEDGRKQICVGSGALV